MEKKVINNEPAENDFDFKETVCSPEFQEGCMDQPEEERSEERV